MKREHWKYLSLTFSIISIISLVYAFVPGINGLNIIEPTDIPYTTIDSVSSKVGILDTSLTLTIIPTGIGLEQVQDEVTGAVYISSQFWWGQGVALGEYKHINGYQLGIGKHGNPALPVYLGISDSSGLNDCFERVIEVPASAIPEEDTLYFVGATFENQPYEENYPILACITDDDHTDGDYWIYGVSENNPCSGTCRLGLYDFDSDAWHVPGDMENYDGTFAIYTEEAAGGGTPPSISISITSYVQTVGFIALLGACFSSIKYGMVIGWF